MFQVEKPKKKHEMMSMGCQEGAPEILRLEPLPNLMGYLP